MRVVLRLLLLCALTVTAPLAARWHEASSAHFVIYADDDPGEIRQFSDQLERFHAAMAFLLHQHDMEAPSPSNRVTIFVVKNEREVRKLAGDAPKWLYAFYVPRAGGSLAIVPAVNTSTGQLGMSMLALLHEYAHHFQLSTERHALPRWVIEGSAEFFSSARFGKDGAVGIGMPANHRAGELIYARDVTATDLLDPESYEKKKRSGYDAYYGKAWLLYHYLTFAPERKGQLTDYLKALRQGTGPAEAARAIFGDLDQLERDIVRYLGKPRITTIQLRADLVKPGPVQMRALSPGEAAMMPVRIRSRRGVTREQAAELLPEAQSIAARFPKDAAVLAALAEAEVDAGNDDAAIAAADAALALDSAQANAYVQKGLALFRKADEASDRAEAYRAARSPFIALNRIENDHPLPLIYYYLSFSHAGLTPNQTAVQALERAVELAPFDLGLRYMLVSQQIQDKRYDRAMLNLAPIAYNPPGGEAAEAARKMLERLKAGQSAYEAEPGQTSGTDAASGHARESTPR